MSRVHQALLRLTPQIEVPADHLNRDNPQPDLSYALRSGETRRLGLPGVNVPNDGDRPPCSALPEPLRQEIMRLVQRVFVFPNSHAPKTVVFSSIEGSGSTEICFRAAEGLAGQVSASVCLVSANLPPSSQDAQKANNWRGLTDAMSSTDPVKDFMVPTICRNLWLMPPGSHAIEDSQFLALDKLRGRIKELKNEFEYILIDAPPVTLSSIAILMGQMADGVVLVLEANSTRRETARMVKEAFESARVKLLGAILNNQNQSISETLLPKR